MQLSGHIAVVDDDPSMRVALARSLAAGKRNCRTYPSALAFLAELPLATPDCLIVDVNIPGMTGLQLQRELLNRGIRIPTIVITAVDNNSIAERAAALGAVDCLTKPFTGDTLMAAVDAATKPQG